MIRAIIETVACFFYPETWYLILNKRINVFTTTGKELKKMFSEKDKEEFLQHVKNDDRRDAWRRFFEY